ncbi:MAG: exo-alpha-sialidase, partial [Anaerolineae bacterium]|nr:exo-alpha-sialidase [Anaerolineae bacterium]
MRLVARAVLLIIALLLYVVSSSAATSVLAPRARAVSVFQSGFNPVRLSGVAALVPVPGPGAPWLVVPNAPGLGLETRMNQDTTIAAQNEPAIAISPLDADVLLGGANDYRLGDSRPGFYASVDGGAHWTDGILPGISPGYFGGDPAVTFDHQGHAYYSFIASKRLSGRIDCREGGVYASRLANNGSGWYDPVRVIANAANLFNDRPFIAADTGLVSPYRGRLYVTWTRFHYTGNCWENDPVTSTIAIAYSTDQGKSWSSFEIVSEEKHSFNQAAYPFVAPDGDLYVVWSNYTLSPQADRIFIARSTD